MLFFIFYYNYKNIMVKYLFVTKTKGEHQWKKN